MKISIDMTAPSRPVGGSKRSGAIFFDTRATCCMYVCLGECPFRKRRKQTDKAAKMARRQKTLCFSILFVICMFTARSIQGLWCISFWAPARPWPSEMKITKIRWTVVLGRPGGMRGGGGRGYGEGLRSLQGVCRSCVLDFTRQLLSSTRAEDRSAHSAELAS